MRVKLIFTFLLFGTVFSLFAAQKSPYAIYYDFENAVFEQTLSDSELTALYKKAQNALQNIEPIEERLFFLARTDFFYAIIPAYEVMNEYYKKTASSKDKKKPKLIFPLKAKEHMLTYFEKANELNEQSIKIKPTANAYMAKSLLTLAIGVLSEGISPKISAAMQFFDLAKVAAKIDPNNFEAQLLLASSKAFPPPPFGNPKKGIEEILVLGTKITDETPKLDLFIVYMTLSQAYFHLKERGNSFLWFSKAQEIYPNNPMLKQFEKKVLELK